MQVLQDELCSKLLRAFQKDDLAETGFVPRDKFFEILHILDINLSESDKSTIKSRFENDGRIHYASITKLLTMNARGKWLLAKTK